MDLEKFRILSTKVLSGEADSDEIMYCESLRQDDPALNKAFINIFKTIKTIETTFSDESLGYKPLTDERCNSLVGDLLDRVNSQSVVKQELKFNPVRIWDPLNKDILSMAEQMKEFHQGSADKIVDSITKTCEGFDSPLESDFFFRLCNCFKLRPLNQFFTASLSHIDERLEDYRVDVYPQSTIDRGAEQFTADFRFIFYRLVKETNEYEVVESIAVEIDAYDLYTKSDIEKIKMEVFEQRLKEEGYYLIKFKGSDIVSNPDLCLQHLTRIILERCSEEGGKLSFTDMKRISN